MEYIDRMIEERADLAIKIDKLEKFLETDVYKNLIDMQQCYLQMQLYHMRGYMDVLRERIKFEELMISDENFRNTVTNKRTILK